jgi:hypothetical protein
VNQDGHDDLPVPVITLVISLVIALVIAVGGTRS